VSPQAQTVREPLGKPVSGTGCVDHLHSCSLHRLFEELLREEAAAMERDVRRFSRYETAHMQWCWTCGCLGCPPACTRSVRPAALLDIGETQVCQGCCCACTFCWPVAGVAPGTMCACSVWSWAGRRPSTTSQAARLVGRCPSSECATGHSKLAGCVVVSAWWSLMLMGWWHLKHLAKQIVLARQGGI
jgi:hypothetical protein